MKLFKHNIFFSILSLTVLLLAGCSADEPFRMQGADGRTTINLLIPSTELARANTRAEGENGDNAGSTINRNILEKEGYIKTLAVVGFYEDGTEKKHFYTPLTASQADVVNDFYRKYTLNVVPADYRLYVLANIPLSSIESRLEADDADIDVSTLENDVKELTYVYNALPTVTGSDPSYLPMAAVHPADVRAEEDRTVTVDLKFVCAKARLTVIYNNAFGSREKGFKITGLDVKNYWTPSDVYVDYGVTGDNATKKDQSVVGTSTHYELTEEDANRTLPDWTRLPGDNENDPLDAITDNAKLEGSEWTQFAWQQIVYIPECTGKGANTTSLLLHTSNKGDKTINIGGLITNASDGTTSPGDITRGNFYDIIAMVTDESEVTYSWKVHIWEPKELSVKLAGISSLFIAETKIDEISGRESEEIYYETDAPSLTFKSCEVKPYASSMTASAPLFDIYEDQDTHNIVVNVNPDLPLKADKLYKEDCVNNEMGFWVVSGTIQKWVEVVAVDLSGYIRLKPDDYPLSIRDIVNSASYTIYFPFATNGSDFKLQMTKYTNTNTHGQPGSTDGYNGTLTDNSIGKGLYIQICDENRQPITDKIPFTSLNTSEDNNLMKTTYLKEGKSYSSEGYIKVVFDAPADATYFSKEIKATFKASAKAGDDPMEDEATLTIVPNPLVYTIHFKAINETWSNPHIYVYQPLLYKGLPVYDNQGNAINFLEYSFTGQMAFRGWQTEGGFVSDYPTKDDNIIDGGGTTVKGYRAPKSWGEANKTSSFSLYSSTNTSAKYQTFQLVDLSQSACSTCSGGNSNLLWPGAGMIKETGENAGWYKIELPLLAKPGSALIMFVDVDSNNHSGEGGGCNHRYPGNNIPGIVLPDYTDREAWYLYDANRGGDKCAFSDDRRDKYGSSGSTGNTNVTVKYRLYWDKGNLDYWKIKIMNASNDEVIMSNTSSSSHGKPYHYDDEMFYCDFEITDTQTNINSMKIIALFGTNGDKWYRKSYDWGKIPLNIGDDTWWHYDSSCQRWVFGDMDGQLHGGDICEN